MIRLLALLGLLLALAAPLAAQPAGDDPASSVRRLYVKDVVAARQKLYSRRLQALFDADARRSRGEVGRLDFDFVSNSQDPDDALYKSAQVTVLRQQGDAAEVSVKFQNYGKPEEIRYDLVRENGRWLIDDARLVGPNGWRLQAILKGR